MLGIGTNEVETFVEKMSKQNVRKGRNDKLIRSVMKDKLEDAEFDERCKRKDFVRNKVEYGRIVRRGSMVDRVFQNLMKYETEQIQTTE